MSEPDNGAPPLKAEVTQPLTPLPPDSPWWALMLVSNWRQCWRWLSTYVTAAAASAPIAYEYLPQIHQFVSDSTFHKIEAGLVALIFLSRIKRQK